MQGNIKLPKTVCDAMDMLAEAGFEAYAVGGCIRDILLKRTPGDFDIATDAVPDEIKCVFGKFKTIDTGIKHGTVTVVMNGFHMEITTYRIDGIYKDNRRPENVVFSRNISEDLSRRDFTLNAMAYNNENGLVDLFGGASDIKDKIIKCVGEPKKRFNEDALRILRAVRFASVLGFEIEINTKKAINEYSGLLDNISKERVFSEIKKLLCGENTENVMLEYRNIIERIFPCVEKYSFNQYKTAAKMAGMQKNDVCMKLSSVFYFLKPDDAYCMLGRLKADNKTRRRVSQSLKNISFEPCCGINDILKLMFYNGSQSVLDALSLRCSYYKSISDKSGIIRAEELLKSAQSALQNGICREISDLAVNGGDILAENIASGKELGTLLQTLLFAVIDKKVENEKSALIDYAKIIIKQL